MPTELYVAVVGGYGDYYEELELDGACARERIAQNAVKHFEIQSSRTNPRVLRVAVYQVLIKNGELERHDLGFIDVRPPFPPLTSIEFSGAFAALYDSVPAEFRDFIRNVVAVDYDMNASLDRLTDAVVRLKEALNEYMPEPPDRLLKLESVVKGVLALKGDDVCWHDVYTEMAELVGVTLEPDLLPRQQFLGNCAHFYDCLAKGEQYVTPSPDAVIAAAREITHGIRGTECLPLMSNPCLLALKQALAEYDAAKGKPS